MKAHIKEPHLPRLGIHLKILNIFLNSTSICLYIRLLKLLLQQGLNRW